MDDKTYTVMELAEAVGVARTTINDWLSKYSPYIDFKTVGRRRVYTAAAVEVLKEISELRNQGLASGILKRNCPKSIQCVPSLRIFRRSRRLRREMFPLRRALLGRKEQTMRISP